MLHLVASATYYLAPNVTVLIAMLLIGPFLPLAGAISDWLEPSLGIESMRYALLSVVAPDGSGRQRTIGSARAR